MSVHQVLITGHGFSPRRVRIAAGDVVKFDNIDHTVHGVEIISPTILTPGSGDIQPGNSYSIRFPVIGFYVYHDARFSQFVGTVRVV